MELIQHTDDLVFLESGLYLWVIHADKVPPHIGISTNGLFFSLKANGKDEQLDVLKILHILKRKKVATLFYAIEPASLKVNVSEVFRPFDCTVHGEITCLSPLKRIFDASDVKLLKDLLDVLFHRGMIKRTVGWQLPASFHGIPDYSVEDIHQRLQFLHHEK